MSSKTKPFPIKSRSAVTVKVIVLTVLVLVFFAAATFFDLQKAFQDMLAWMEQSGPVGPLVFFVLYVIACVFMLPGTILTLGAGAVFGVGKGFVIVSISSTVGATAAFLVGRYLARGFVARRIEGNPTFQAMDEAVAEEGWKIVGLTRLSPVFPFNLLNYAFGLTRVSLRDYVLASWIGMIPGTIMYVYLGSLAGNLAELGTHQGESSRSFWGWALYIVGLIATVAVTVVITRVARRTLGRRINASPEENAIGMTEPPSNYEVKPRDQYNEKLVEHVHPRNWTSPEPAPMYNLVVVGAGTAGLITSIGCAALGGKVALVERHLMGGDCLNTGCVPSKCLIRCARAASEMATADRFGLTPHPATTTDFATVMERMRRLRASISENDSAQRFSELGVDVFFGQGSFVGPNTMAVGEKTLHFRKAVIATGARAIAPDIPGLAETGYLTNETVFNLTELPPRLAVIGGGPIGCELAQAFRRLGAEVTIVQQSRFLPREDEDASQLLADVFHREGIRVLLESKPVRVENLNGCKKITIKSKSEVTEIEVDEILVGTGRQPNVEGLGLEQAGVDYDPRGGVLVDDFLRTTNRAIFAAGDICMDWKFTHAADAAARIAIQNALFRGKKRLSSLNMPWCTYTDPEIAHVGLYEADAKARGIATDIYRVDLSEIDRAIVDGETEGFVKILVKKGTDRIVGATIVAAHAGDLISEISVAMAGKIGLKKIADVIHPYPTQAEAIRRVAANYNRTRLTPRVAAILKWWLKWQRR